MALRAADAAKAMDVDDLHAAGSRSAAMPSVRRARERRSPRARRAGSPRERGSAPCRRTPSPSACRSEQEQRQRRGYRRGSRAQPGERERVRAPGRRTARRRCGRGAKPRRSTSPSSTVTDGSPQHPDCLRGQLRLLAGLRRARSRAPRRGRTASARTRRPSWACRRRQVGGELGPWRRAGQLRHLVDPASAAQDLVSRRIVRLPQRACIGRDRGAADRDVVAHDPRARRRLPAATTSAAAASSACAPRRDRPERGSRRARAGSSVRRALPRIASPVATPAAAAMRARGAFGRDARREG